MTDDNDATMVIVCAGPPLCSLEGGDAVAAQQAGCDLCRRIAINPDGTETVKERTIQ